MAAEEHANALQFDGAVSTFFSNISKDGISLPLNSKIANLRARVMHFIVINSHEGLDGGHGVQCC